MSGALAAMVGWSRAALNTTITVGDDGGTTYGYFTGVFGALGDDTFDDNTATSRTVAGVTNNHSTDVLVMELAGTSIANSGATFESISVEGARFYRDDATYLADTGGGNTRWSWSTAADPMPTSGSAALIVSV